MAAIATQVLAPSTAFTTAGDITTVAASAGGDTVEAGSAAGGWAQPVLLYVIVGPTATTITVQGVAYGPYTSRQIFIPLATLYRGSRIAVTYSQVASVVVGVLSLSAALTGVTWGT